MGLASVLCLGSALVLAPSAKADNGWVAVNGATCVHEAGGVCKVFAAKEDVWLDGATVASKLPPGDYFFAVLQPGGQGDPNDDGSGNLSASYDSYNNRTFTITTGGSISYGGTHGFDSTKNMIQLAPFGDTPNPAGVCVLAVCSLANGYPVGGGSSRFDVFKVQPGQPPITGQGLTILKDATASFTRAFAWTIAKGVDKTLVKQPAGTPATFNYTVTVTHDKGTDSAWQVSGTITVNNPNAFDITGVSVTDAIFDPNATCVVTGGNDATIPASSSVDFSYTCTYSAAPASQDEINEATVTWPDQKDAGENVVLAAGAVFFDLPFSFPANPTTLVDDSVSVTDTLGGTLGTVASTDPSPKTFTYSHAFTAPAGTCTTYPNTATFTTDTTATTGSASQSVKVCTGTDLQVSKTAIPAFTRTYAWRIGKGVDKTRVEQIGGTAAFNYAVNATQTGFLDSLWVVAGSITIANPNDWEAITVNVTDLVDGGGLCAVSGGSGVVVPALGSVTLPYSCTYASAPSPSSGNNTATATWDPAAYFTPHGSASGLAGFAFTTPTTLINQTVTVQDTFNGTTTTLGTTPAATDTQPFTSETFTYARSIVVPAFGCLSYLNTAKIGQTGQSASQTVTVCGPVNSGALSKGFWQNKNGQGIITGGAYTGTGKVANSGTWLRQFLPFQDLSATATLAQVATYVNNVINGATAAGATMNPMLKAQMLATALDVYFSDPALGGNKITAPAPLGGVCIDLTKIDSPYENVSSAFGNATGLTVSQMLAYAAGKSNVGGSTWYGNVKATQGLAKDAFDAIDNELAFGCP